MSITSIAFVLFLYIVFIVYYCIPKKLQWYSLLAASIFIYCLWSIKGLGFLLISSTTVYVGARFIDLIDEKTSIVVKNSVWNSNEEKKSYRKKQQKKKKVILLITLLCNLGILSYFKYTNFLIEQLILLLKTSSANVSIVKWMPLGLSFYTFQLIGYLLDVYWGYYKSEKSWTKMLLFTSFFPQVTQGPISSFEQLNKELFKEHSFAYSNFSFGSMRLFWGLTKKMVIADNLAPIVREIFYNYNSYSGVTVSIGALLYAIQIYMDFAGYMDIMCGFCTMLDITLAENFCTPYFSKSVAEYWRRWHITLGDWFKKYIYYPIAMSSTGRKIGKNITQKTNKHIGNSVPATIALVVTWLATGLWHGASWAYIVWGLMNGFFIILTLWMEPLYEMIYKILRINKSSKTYMVFQFVRTFVIVALIKVFPEVGDIKDGLGYWNKIFTGSYSIGGWSEFLDILVPAEAYLLKFKLMVYFFVSILLVIAFIISIAKYRGIDEKAKCLSVPWYFRMLMVCGMFVIILIVGIPASSESVFMYAGF